MALTPVLLLPYPNDSDNPSSLFVSSALANLAGTFDGNSQFGPWVSWTPQVDQGATTNITKAIQVAHYRQIGHFYEFEFKLTMSASGTASAKVTVTAPVTGRNAGFIPLGWGSINDVSATSNYQRAIHLDSGSTTKMVWRAAAGLLGASGFTAALASGDIITGVGFGECV